MGFRRSGFSPLSRYSCLHPHFHAVHRGSRLRLRPAWKAPLPIESIDSAASAPCLSPAHCRRAPTRPVSCYALFECMAASKQPSKTANISTATRSPAFFTGKPLILQAGHFYLTRLHSSESSYMALRRNAGAARRINDHRHLRQERLEQHRI